MFGAPAPTPFGQPAGGAAPFGSPAPAPAAGGFGAFGSPAPAPAAGGFGGFGSPAPAPAATGFGGFGAPAPAPAATGFGGFGAPAPAPSAFGAPAPAPTPFGSPAPAPAGGGLFGGGANTTSAFGSPAPAPAFGATGTTGFGAPAAAPATPFGAPAPAPAGGGLFGGGTSGGAFGAAPAPATAGFGGFGAAPAPAPSTGLFGSTAPAPAATGFGGFGATSPAPAPNMFGATSPGVAGQPGTSAVPYAVTSKTDGATMINLQTITAMPAYEAKSPEELRLEDYMAGNKGRMGQPGAPAPATGAFGAPAAPAPAFGAAPAAPAPAFGGFGAPAPAAPAPAGGLFGAPAPAPSTGLFGAPAAAAPAAGGLFGAPAPAAPAPAFGGFGAASPTPAPAAGGSLFGAPAPAPAGGGLFGAPAPGAPAPAPAGGLFGAPAPAAPAPAFGGFGAPAPAAPAPAGGLFGATPAPAPAAGGLFGAPAAAAPAPAAGGLFGATPAPAPAAGGLFGSPAPAPAGGSLFGAPAPAPATGGFFGAPAPAAPATGGLFGAPAPAPATGGLFGALAPAPAAGGLFGSPPPAAPAAVATAASIAPPPTADALLKQQFAALENQKKELALYEAWRGQAPSGSSVIPTSLSEQEATGRGGGPGDNGSAAASNRSAAYAASSGLFLAYQAAPRSTAKIRPRGFAPAKSPAVIGSIGKMGAGGASPMMSPDAYLGSSAKRLTIKPGSLTPKPKMRLLLTDGNGDEKKEESPAPSTNGAGNSMSAQRDTPASAARRESTGADIGTNTPTAPAFASPLAASSPSPNVAPSPAKESTATPASAGPRQSPASSSKKAGGAGYDFYRTIVGENGTTPSATSNLPAYVPKLTKGGGYSVSPSAETMAQMSEADLAAVSDFVVSREGLGSIAWEGAVDVRGVDLDTVVEIKFRDVAVYDAEEENGTKPPLGSKLNRPAVITMYDVFPKDGGADASEETRSKFEKRISKSTKKMGAELISYNAGTGVWKFRVLHFSRYNLDDSDDEQEESQPEAVVAEPVATTTTTTTTTTGTATEASSDFEQRGRGGRPRTSDRSGGRSTRLAYLDDDDDEDDDAMAETDDEDSSSAGALTSEAEGGQSDGGEQQEMEASLQKADDAYAMLTMQMESDDGNFGVAEGFEEAPIFNDEGESASEHCSPAPSPAVIEPAAAPIISPGEGISARLARKYGVKTTTSSKTDFGMRMGRSFRVGWRPDGSFVYPRVAQSSAFTLNTVQIHQARPVIGTVEDSLPLLQVHLKNSVADSTTDDCPTYSLPSIANPSQSSDGAYSALCSTLDDYSSESADNASGDNTSDPEVAKVVPRAFSLLSTLYGREENGDANISNERRAEGVKMWLRNAASDDMIASIKSSKNQGKSLQAVFDALSGGNIAKASSLAIEEGHLRLATLLTSNDLQTRQDMLEQMHLAGQAPSLSPELRRVYALLAGNFEEEEGIFQAAPGSLSTLDWRRRLIQKIMFSSDDAALPTVLQEVAYDIERRVFPEPRPRHLSSGSSDDYCVLYQMLQVWATNSGSTDASQTSLSSLVNPLAHTASEHDFSMSFHLASALSAVGCCAHLSAVDEARMVDSYVNQLLSVGLWEWAVYVCICSCSASSTRDDLKELWKQRAADIISRFYHSSSDVGSNARSFLESKVGIPKEWFDSATVNRSLFCGDQQAYISAIFQMDPSEALRCYEDELLPTLLFNGLTSDYESNIASLLDSGDPSAMTDSVTRKLVGLSQEVLQISRGEEQVDSAETIPELQFEANELRRQLIEESASLALPTSSKEVTGKLWSAHFAADGSMKRVPLTVFYAEASSWVALMQLQLAALAAGQSIFDNDAIYGSSERQRLKYASQLSHFSRKSGVELSEPFLGARDFTRGMA